MTRGRRRSWLHCGPIRPFNRAVTWRPGWSRSPTGKPSTRRAPGRGARSRSIPSRNAGLWDALQALPFKQRMAVAYHYVAGMPYADVATITGGTQDAARRAAADGIATLRKTYGEGGPR
jgi:DNA-directed RNA polymerase specialized sigma24 family protein